MARVGCRGREGVRGRRGCGMFRGEVHGVVMRRWEEGGIREK